MVRAYDGWDSARRVVACCRSCVLGAALWVAGVIGLVEVVTGGDVVTLYIVAPPSEVGDVVTL